MRGSSVLQALLFLTNLPAITRIVFFGDCRLIHSSTIQASNSRHVAQGRSSDYPELLGDFSAILGALLSGNYRIQAQLSTLNCGVLPPPHTYAVPLTYWLLHEDTDVSTNNGSTFQYITFSHFYFDGKTRMFDINNGEIRQDGTVTFQARSYLPWDGEVHQTFTFECKLNTGMIIYGVKMDRFSERINDYRGIKNAILRGSPIRGQYDGRCSGYLQELTAGGNVLASELMNNGTDNEHVRLHWSFVQAETGSLNFGSEVATYVADLEISPDGEIKTRTSLWDPHSWAPIWNASATCNLTSLMAFTEEDSDGHVFLDSFEEIKLALMNGHRLTLNSRLPLFESSPGTNEGLFLDEKVSNVMDEEKPLQQIRQRDFAPWTLRAAPGALEAIQFTFYRVTGEGKELVEEYTLLSNGKVVVEDFLFDRLRPEGPGATLVRNLTFTLGDGDVLAAMTDTQLRAIQSYSIATLELGLLGRPATAVVNFTNCQNSEDTAILAKGLDINERNYATVDGSPIQVTEDQVRIKGRPAREQQHGRRQQSELTLAIETTYAEITPDEVVIVTSNEVDSVAWEFLDGSEVTSVCPLHNGLAGAFFIYVPV